MKYKIYGIPNCDVIAKTTKWLKSKDIDFSLHNYKAEGISKEKLEEWLKQVPFEKLVNRASTTWKELSDAEKSEIKDNESAIKLMMSHTSVIKRPVLESNKILAIGFKIEEYEKIFP